MFSPAQLCFLVSTLDRTKDVEGSLLEVGCFYGATTLFLNEHLRRTGSEKRYFALDTFEGFREEDIVVESDRGRRDPLYGSAFRRNRVEYFRRTMALNRITRVEVFQADAKRFDFATIAPFSFCLIDVDLYQPVRSTLEAVYDLMAPSGVIVVDDCNPDNPVWRGAYEAYREFVDAREKPIDIRLDKLGVIVR
jgi:O-methyltransferase